MAREVTNAPVDVVVLVGRTYGDNVPTSWDLWSSLPFEGVVAEVTKRQREHRVDGAKFQIIEVAVQRRTQVTSEVKVEKL